jgi:hypothetical protein
MRVSFKRKFNSKHIIRGEGVSRATVMLTFHLSNQDLQMVSFQFENQNRVKSILLPKQ